MLFYGNSSCINILSKDTIIYNVTSMIEGVQKLYIVPPNNIGHSFDRDFDIDYANYIMLNDNIFCEFFKIIFNLYTSNDVYLIFSDDDWSENIAESLFKLIQQRYGYNVARINEYEDYIFAKNNMHQGFDPYYGIANLDMDKERFAYITENVRLLNGGQVYTED